MDPCWRPISLCSGQVGSQRGRSLAEFSNYGVMGSTVIVCTYPVYKHVRQHALYLLFGNLEYVVNLS